MAGGDRFSSRGETENHRGRLRRLGCIRWEKMEILGRKGMIQMILTLGRSTTWRIIGNGINARFAMRQLCLLCSAWWRWRFQFIGRSARPIPAPASAVAAVTADGLFPAPGPHDRCLPTARPVESCTAPVSSSTSCSSRNRRAALHRDSGTRELPSIRPDPPSGSRIHVHTRGMDPPRRPFPPRLQAAGGTARSLRPRPDRRPAATTGRTAAHAGGGSRCHPGGACTAARYLLHKPVGIWRTSA